MDYLRWDPSGRYLVDAIQQPMGNSYYKYSYDNGERVFGAWARAQDREGARD